jgi:hypothetical protein
MASNHPPTATPTRGRITASARSAPATMKMIPAVERREVETAAIDFSLGVMVARV